MGYYERADLPFYYALADNFTLMDSYHASILGPTHPNRLMANSGTIDPGGTQGGPVTDTNFTPDVLWNCRWSTMQEILEDAGVAWKVYKKAFLPTFPNDLVADIATGALPAVSWIIPPLGFDEHPSASPANGMYFTSLILDALTANPEMWSKTALFLMYDENDGWFDHVAPPTAPAPAGTPGEYLTATPSPILDPKSDTLGITGPLGLGVRVPALAISPFSRGGHIASQTFDHTSQLQLVGERFNVEVPNVSAWRKRTVGDLTSALFAGKYTTILPKRPAPVLPPQTFSGSCSVLDQDTESGGAAPSVPTNQTMPNQQGGTQPASQYFPSTTTAADRESRTVLGPADPRPVTTKSAYNRLLATALGPTRVNDSNGSGAVVR